MAWLAAALFSKGHGGWEESAAPQRVVDEEWRGGGDTQHAICTATQQNMATPQLSLHKQQHRPPHADWPAVSPLSLPLPPLSPSPTCFASPVPSPPIHVPLLGRLFIHTNNNNNKIKTPTTPSRPANLQADKTRFDLHKVHTSIIKNTATHLPS